MRTAVGMSPHTSSCTLHARPPMRALRASSGEFLRVWPNCELLKLRRMQLHKSAARRAPSTSHSRHGRQRIDDVQVGRTDSFILGGPIEPGY